jgi:hypothetical protein
MGLESLVGRLTWCYDPARSRLSDGLSVSADPWSPWSEKAPCSMSLIWPKAVAEECARSADNALRPFRCVLLMPFGGRFTQVAEIVKGRDSVRFCQDGPYGRTCH